MLKTTQVERRLIEAAQAGQLLDVSNESERDVRAVVIRGLLCGWHTKALDPRGVRLRGAHIVEELDLTDVRASVPLVLHSCEHDESIILTRARLPHLDLTESAFPALLGNDFTCESDGRLESIQCGQLNIAGANFGGDCDLSDTQLTATSCPALNAEGATVGGSLRLNRGVVTSSDSEEGALHIARSTIAGQMNLIGAHLTATNGPALTADELTVGRSMLLKDGIVASSHSKNGALRLVDAKISGQFSLRRATLTATNGPALSADGATVGQNLYLDDGFTASSDSNDGTLRLYSTTITGQLCLRGATLTATNGPALSADGATVGISLLLDDGFTASSDSEDGTIRLLRASIGRQLSMRRATLTATNGRALEADGIIVNGSMLLNSFVASSDSQNGIMGLNSAHITGILSLSGAELTATNGTALEGSQMTVGESLSLTNLFAASSNSEDATVQLFGASVAGQLNLNKAKLIGTNEPALSADGLTVGGDLFLHKGFTASSGSKDGTIRLIGASISGQLSLRGAELSATNGCALNADGLNVGGALFLDSGLTATSDSTSGTLSLRSASLARSFALEDADIKNIGNSGPIIDMSGTQVDGTLSISPSSFTSDEERLFCIDLNGLRYPLIPQVATIQDWLTLLLKHTSEYAAQPYQQLAAVYRAAGHDREARKILITQQRDLRRRGDIGGPGRKFLHALGGLFIGYGHRPFRALGFLAGVCLLSGVVVLNASLWSLAVHPGPSNTPCSLAENFSLAMDTAIPALKYSGGKHCEILATTDWGQLLYVATYLLHMLGWAFATLFVAGYTGLVRKTT